MKFKTLTIIAFTLFTTHQNAQNSINNLKKTTDMTQNIDKTKGLNLNYPFSLPKLNFGYDALEPYIDKETMLIHYSKHHQAYVDNLNKAIDGTDANLHSLGELMQSISKYTAAVRNNGGGHYNHSLFWSILSPTGGILMDGDLKTAINNQFGNFENFKTQFSDAAKSRFGSGWAWLSVDENKKLFISSTANQDNPLMDVVEKKGIPILGLDVWEHAYYLKYQNRRPDYIENFWKVINWQEVEQRYLAIIK